MCNILGLVLNELNMRRAGSWSGRSDAGLWQRDAGAFCPSFLPGPLHPCHLPCMDSRKSMLSCRGRTVPEEELGRVGRTLAVRFRTQTVWRLTGSARRSRAAHGQRWGQSLSAACGLLACGLLACVKPPSVCSAVSVARCQCSLLLVRPAVSAASAQEWTPLPSPRAL